MKKRPLFTIFLVVFFDLLSFGIVIPILPYYSRTFNANAFTLGWLMASYSIAQFLFAPLWGSLSDRLGRRPILLSTIFAGSLSMTATALAPTLPILFAARLLAGAFAANISTASAYIADITTEENRAKGMGVIGAAFGLGFIFGPAIGGILSAQGHYSVPILLAAALGVCNFLFAFFVLHEPERHHVAGRSRFAGVSSALAKPKTALPIGLFFLHTLGFTQLEVAFGLFVLERFHYGPMQAGSFLAGMGFISAMLQGGLIGRLSKKFGETSLLVAGFTLLTLSLAAASYSQTPMIFGAWIFLLAIGTGMVSPCLSSLASKGAGPEERGSVMGVYQSGSSLARVIGPPVAGFCFDHFGSGSPLQTSSALMLVGLAVALGARKKLA
jgi:MFS transporter, DHA1 family, tetracycline resistance protein